MSNIEDVLVGMKESFFTWVIAPIVWVFVPLIWIAQSMVRYTPLAYLVLYFVVKNDQYPQLSKSTKWMSERAYNYWAKKKMNKMEKK